MKRRVILVSQLVLLVMTIAVLGQIPVPPPGATAPLRSSTELDQLLGPIALYPDPLIAQILPAATLPSEVVMADRFLRGGGDPNQIDLQTWDQSIKALARYPTVLSWMDDNLAWTTDAGQAFLDQETDVMDSIQRLRARASALGNLQSTPQQTVIDDGGTIEIVPANPEVVYVPVYPTQEVYVQPPPSPGFFVSFGLGLPVGLWLNHDFDWRDRRVIVWRHDQPRPRDWWTRPPSRRPVINNINVWHPQDHPSPALPNRLDRGWGTREASHTVAPRPVVPREAPHPVVPRPVEPRRTVERPPSPPPARAVPERPAPIVRERPSNSALIGVHSAQDTRDFSNRGAQSRQAIISRPAPSPMAVARPVAPRAPSPSPERNRK